MHLLFSLCVYKGILRSTYLVRECKKKGVPFLERRKIHDNMKISLISVWLFGVVVVRVRLRVRLRVRVRGLQ